MATVAPTVTYHDPVKAGKSPNQCRCPTCVLSAFMAGVYESQFQDVYRGARSVQPTLKTCPMFDTYGFCVYSCTCLLKHDHGPWREAKIAAAQASGVAPVQLTLGAASVGGGDSAAAPRAPPVDSPAGAALYGSDAQLISPPGARRSVESLIEQALQLDREHDEGYYKCTVCGLAPFPLPFIATKVGETGQAVTCPRCTTAVYFPVLLLLIECLLLEAADDAQHYKDRVDAVRKQLPEEMKIPFSYEAHRIASTYFAWSLASKADADAALAAVADHMAVVPLPVRPGAAGGTPAPLKYVYSVGSGTGYIEHVFNQAQLASKRGLSFFAFDEIVRPARFSVTVCYGSPSSLQSLDGVGAVLLLCWPPFASHELQQSTMAFDALRFFMARGGRYVIYIGDTASTGDWQFHQLLLSHFQPLKEYRVRKEVRRWHPQEMGLVFAGNDTIGAYVARDVPLPPLAPLPRGAA